MTKRSNPDEEIDRMIKRQDVKDDSNNNDIKGAVNILHTLDNNGADTLFCKEAIRFGHVIKKYSNLFETEKATKELCTLISVVAKRLGWQISYQPYHMVLFHRYRLQIKDVEKIIAIGKFDDNVKKSLDGSVKIFGQSQYSWVWACQMFVENQFKKGRRGILPFHFYDLNTNEWYDARIATKTPDSYTLNWNKSIYPPVASGRYIGYGSAELSGIEKKVIEGLFQQEE